MYGIRPGQLRPRDSSPIPASISGKHGFLFSELVRIASFKRNPLTATSHVRKLIQELVRAELTPDEFVIHLEQMFGSYQPHIIHFLQTHPINFRPLTSQKDIQEAMANNPRKIIRPYKPPPEEIEEKEEKEEESTSDYSQVSTVEEELLSCVPNIRPFGITEDDDDDSPNSIFGFQDKEEDHDDHSMHSFDDFHDFDIPDRNSPPPPLLTPASQPPKLELQHQPAPLPPPPPIVEKPVYVEPNDPLMNAAGVLKYCNQGKNSFKAISQDAVNFLGDFVNVRFRVFLEDVLHATKSRQPVSHDDDKDVEMIDPKEQLKYLDTYYLVKDLKDSDTDEAKRIMTSVNNRKVSAKEVEAFNLANEVAMAALRVKKKGPAWADTTIKDVPKSKNPYITPCRINTSDVIFAMQRNKRLQKTWAYRGALFLSLSTKYNSEFI